MQFSNFELDDTFSSIQKTEKLISGIWSKKGRHFDEEERASWANCHEKASISGIRVFIKKLELFFYGPKKKVLAIFLQKPPSGLPDLSPEFQISLELFSKKKTDISFEKPGIDYYKGIVS